MSSPSPTTKAVTLEEAWRSLMFTMSQDFKYQHLFANTCKTALNRLMQEK